jgi:general secretion pathway protein B
MSLILEALKKSEAKRQLGEAPGLGTPFTVARRRRSPLPLIVLLILVAAGFGWYYWRTPSPATAVGVGASKPPTVPMTVTANANPQVAPTTVAAAPDAARAMNRLNPPTAPPRAAARTDQSQIPSSAAQQGAPGTRPDPRQRGAFNQPGAARPEGGMDKAAARMAERFARRPSGPTNGAPNPAPADSGFLRAPNAIPPAVATAQAATATAVQQVATPPAPASGVEQSAPAPTPASARPAADLPMYYELPFNVRKDLPALAVSMHVYAAVPAQRFVVIDGERRSEGEVVKEGLTLREIRSDGIVLDLRGQRFFYPRPGGR